jgi:hypothetical protein
VAKELTLGGGAVVVAGSDGKADEVCEGALEADDPELAAEDDAALEVVVALDVELLDEEEVVELDALEVAVTEESIVNWS